MEGTKKDFIKKGIKFLLRQVDVHEKSANKLYTQSKQHDFHGQTQQTFKLVGAQKVTDKQPFHIGGFAFKKVCKKGRQGQHPQAPQLNAHQNNRLPH